MRADIQPGAHATAGIAMHDQRFRIASHHRFDFAQAVRGHAFHPQQGRVRHVERITV